MDILCKTQNLGDIFIVVPFTSAALAFETSSTLTVKVISPAGVDITATVTAPTITEVVAGQGIYLLKFAIDAISPVFVLTNQLNPYTLVIKTNVLTGYRTTIRVYCVDRLPGEIAKSAEIATLSGITALDATVAKAAALTTLSGIMALDATVAKTATVALNATVAKAADMPSLAQIEASTVLAKELTLGLVKKFITNKKTLIETGGVYSLVIYDDNNIDEILRKAIKDIAGADITAIGNGVIAREMKSSV